MNCVNSATIIGTAEANFSQEYGNRLKYRMLRILTRRGASQLSVWVRFYSKTWEPTGLFLTKPLGWTVAITGRMSAAAPADERDSKSPMTNVFTAVTYAALAKPVFGREEEDDDE